MQQADLRWNAQGTPISNQFDDIYFSDQDGIAETNYVFLAGNGLPERFITHPDECMVIGETGFGTGLNFLVLCQAFYHFRQHYPDAALKRLHFISCEMFPLSLEQLKLTYQHFPQLDSWSSQLMKQWPLCVLGCHRLYFADNTISLDLWFADINSLLSDFNHSLCQRIDAWFLDGFAPTKNPQMWSHALFKTLANTTKPSATFATFTAVSAVRRGLMKVGFIVNKRPGFAAKREMLVGHLPPFTNAKITAHHARNTTPIAVIGGGIASALLCEALMRRGVHVVLYCEANAAANGASGNRQGVLYPLLNHANPLLSQFFAQAFLYARRHYELLFNNNVNFDHAWCGVTQLAYNEKVKQTLQKALLAGWPTQLVKTIAAETLSEQCGLVVPIGGISYSLGGWLSPQQLTKNLILSLIQTGLQVEWNTPITELEQYKMGWLLKSSTGKTQYHSHVILANGHQITQFSQTRSLPLTPIRGQVSYLSMTHSPSIQKLQQVLCYDGYLTPVNSNDGICSMGASYIHHSTAIEHRVDEHKKNYQNLCNTLPNTEWVEAIDISEEQTRSGIRSVARDHWPMVGTVPNFSAIKALYPVGLKMNIPEQIPQELPVYPNLFMLGGLGSRGLCSTPLLAELLVSQLLHEPLPVNQAIQQQLNPNRQWRRKLIKGSID